MVHYLMKSHNLKINKTSIQLRNKPFKFGVISYFNQAVTLNDHSAQTKVKANSASFGRAV